MPRYFAIGVAVCLAAASCASLLTRGVSGWLPPIDVKLVAREAARNWESACLVLAMMGIVVGTVACGRLLRAESRTHSHRSGR